MIDDAKKTTSTSTGATDSNKSKEEVLDRDQHSPVSVSPEDKEKPSYTHNADKSDPIDPHLSDDNPPGKVSGSKNVEEDVLDRDKPGPVSVSPEGEEEPSYTHNADKSDPIDPHLSDDNPPEKV